MYLGRAEYLQPMLFGIRLLIDFCAGHQLWLTSSALKRTF